MPCSNQAVAKELERIASEHGGFLKPEDVIEEAKPKGSPLHDCFTWNNSEAAHQYRLQEARNLIRVVVSYDVSGVQCNTPVKVWHSLTADRQSHVGYRAIGDVMKSGELREQLLADALSEMKKFQMKYQCLSELSNVFKEMNKIAA